MGIDRIGKGGGMPPTPDAAGGVDKATKTGAVEKTFSVDRPKETAPVAGAESVSAASPLAQLRAGQIDVERYLDLKVDEATRGLDGLPPADLADIKSMLRDQLATDPGLANLVRSATGQIPKPPEEG